MLTSVAPLRLAPQPQRFAPVWLVAAIVLSVVVHTVVLFVQFVMPESKTPSKAVIEMILVNDYNQQRNEEAKVFANAALQGGGDAESGRKTSPLARSEEDKNGTSLQAQQASIASAEQAVKQKLLASRAPGAMKEFNVDGMTAKERQEWQESFAVIARRQAEIEKNIQDYNARPRKYFDGPHTNSHEAAVYVQQWRNRVEDWGNQHYPEEARGKLYGDVILTVEIDNSGRALAINVQKSSGHSVLDKAAIDSIKRSAPFGRFTSSMKNTMDVLVLTRTWSYSPNGLATKAQDS